MLRPMSLKMELGNACSLGATACAVTAEACTSGLANDSLAKTRSGPRSVRIQVCAGGIEDDVATDLTADAKPEAAEEKLIDLSQDVDSDFEPVVVRKTAPATRTSIRANPWKRQNSGEGHQTPTRSRARGAAAVKCEAPAEAELAEPELQQQDLQMPADASTGQAAAVAADALAEPAPKKTTARKNTGGNPGRKESGRKRTAKAAAAPNGAADAGAVEGAAGPLEAHAAEVPPALPVGKKAAQSLGGATTKPSAARKASNAKQAAKVKAENRLVARRLSAAELVAAREALQEPEPNVELRHEPGIQSSNVCCCLQFTAHLSPITSI